MAVKSEPDVEMSPTPDLLESIMATPEAKVGGANLQIKQVYMYVWPQCLVIKLVPNIFRPMGLLIINGR